MNLKNAHTSKEILSDFTERIIRGTLAKYVHSKKKDSPSTQYFAIKYMESKG